MAKTRPVADCGSDHQLLIAKLRLKQKKTRKNTRSVRYDLNQIPYEFTVEVMNRFKRLEFVKNVPEELWMKVHTVQVAANKTNPKRKKSKKAKWLSEEALQIAGIPGGSEVKASACNAGDPGSIPELGRSPGEGNGNPLQYSCLENPMEGRA